jgi:hypothetical protein
VYIVVKYYFHPHFSICVSYHTEHVIYRIYMLNVWLFNIELSKKKKNLGIERIHTYITHLHNECMLLEIR